MYICQCIYMYANCTNKRRQFKVRESCGPTAAPEVRNTYQVLI